jgi:hypothetical protein
MSSVHTDENTAPTSTFLLNSSARNQTAVAEKCAQENIWSQKEYSTKMKKLQDGQF